MISTSKIQYAVINGVEIKLSGIRTLVKKAILNLQDEGYCYTYVTRGIGKRTSYEYLGNDILKVLAQYNLKKQVYWRNISPRGGKWGEQYVLIKKEEVPV